MAAHLYELGVNLALRNDALKQSSENLLRAALGEAALFCLRDGGPEGRDDDDCKQRSKHGNMQKLARVSRRVSSTWFEVARGPGGAGTSGVTTKAHTYHHCRSWRGRPAFLAGWKTF